MEQSELENELKQEQMAQQAEALLALLPHPPPLPITLPPAPQDSKDEVLRCACVGHRQADRQAHGQPGSAGSDSELSRP